MTNHVGFIAGLVAPVMGTGSPSAEGIPAVKSLVFIVQGQPLVLLLLVSDRVDVRKVVPLMLSCV